MILPDNPGENAVEAIEMAQEGTPAYYTVSGRKVSDPDKGIYIMIQNGKASKVIR